MSATTPPASGAPADVPALPAWIRTAICWQVYPLGFCGAPRHREDLVGESYGEGAGENVVHRLGRVVGWLDHLVSLGANVLILNPIFDSVSHGYDTLDHRRLDPRLGDDADFAQLVAACHERGIRLVLDGVFNHVSHHHPVVRAALAAGPDSPEGRRIRWADSGAAGSGAADGGAADGGAADGTTGRAAHPYGFEGNADLVELNLADPVVQDRIVEVMGWWLDRGADGWRLDAMYSAGAEAWEPILARVRAAHPEAWILGEVIHGDYPSIAQASGAHSVTQYELWKAVWSSLADGNLWELAHALGRHEQFLAEFLAEGLPLTFVGNHDTTRIASQLPDGRDLAVAIALLALLPGVPVVYAGDEFGATGVKEERAGGDDAVRLPFPDDPADAPARIPVLSPEAAPRILEAHRRLLGLRRRHPWLQTASVHVPEDALANEHALIELRARTGGERLLLALNLSDEPAALPVGRVGEGVDGRADESADGRSAAAADGRVPGTVLELLSGADMLDGVGAPADGAVPAHGVAVLC
ncbi:alpha-amylase family glycosyl hydrolase [Brachybacterium sp. DNPG3]